MNLNKIGIDRNQIKYNDYELLRIYLEDSINRLLKYTENGFKFHILFSDALLYISYIENIDIREITGGRFFPEFFVVHKLDIQDLKIFKLKNSFLKI